MPSAKLTALSDLAGGQVPTDLAYIVDGSAGTSGSKKSTLNDFIATITKNVTDISLQWQSGDGVSTVSAASQGKIRFSAAAAGAAGSFQASENGAAYQNLIKGPASAGDLTANLFPFATASDVIGDTALAQLGSGTSRTFNFNANNPGTSLSSYGSHRGAIVDQSGMISLGLLGIAPAIKGTFFGGSVASPTAPTAGNTLFSLTASGQYSTTPGQTSNSVIIKAYAVENWSSSAAGASLEFLTNTKGTLPNNQASRLIINQKGCVHVAPTVTNGESSTGTSTVFQVGVTNNLDNAAVAMIIGNGTGASKNLVLQRAANQDTALLQTQSATGVAQFSIVPQLGVECHYFVWVGSTNTPTISSAGETRLYVSSGGKLQISENGGAWQDVVSGGSGTVNSGTQYQIGYYAATGDAISGLANWTTNAQGNFTLAPTASTSGSPSLLTVTGPAHTTLTASTEAIDLNFNLARTVQFAAGAITTQRAVVFQAPTYSFTSASTITTAATVAITGPPTAGANATLTRKLGLWVQGGALYTPHVLIGNSTQTLTTELVVGVSAGAGLGDVGIGGSVFGGITGNTGGFGGGTSIGFNYAGQIVLGTTSQVVGLIDGPTGIWSIGNNTVTSAQANIIARSASRVAFRVDSLTNSTVDLAQFNLNADDTSTVANLATFAANSNGTAATGFGSSFTWTLESSTTADQNAASLAVLWQDATHATRTSAITFSTVSNAGALAERIRINGAGLGVGLTPTVPLHVKADATNQGIELDSNSGAVTSMWYSDGSSLFFGALSNHTVELYSNGTTAIAFTQNTLGFLGKTPAAQQTGGAATAGGTYGATEQGMLQKAYDCLRTFGLLS